MRHCFICSASHYLKTYCILVSFTPSCSYLRSSAQGHLVVPQVRTSMSMPWLNLGVLLLWACPTGTSYLNPIETSFLYCLISSANTWKPPSLLLKTLTRVGSDSEQVALYNTRLRFVLLIRATDLDSFK